MDGSSIEIANEVGLHNVLGSEEAVHRRFSFGPSFEQQEQQEQQEHGQTMKPIPSSLQAVFRELLLGTIVSPEEAKFIIQPLQNGDYFRVCADFDDYVRVQEEMQALWKDKSEWTRRSIETVAGMGKFSSDNAWTLTRRIKHRIAKYCQYVWNVRPLEGTAAEIKRTRSFPRLNSIPKDLVSYH